MPKLDLTTLYRELESGSFKPVYAIVGEEGYLAQGAIEMIRNKFTSRDDGCSVLSRVAGEISSSELISHLKSYSLLGGYNLVIISNAEKLKGEISDQILDYLKDPSPHSSLVLRAEKLDGRSKLSSLLAKVGDVVECKPLYPNKVPQWVAYEVRRRGKQISQDGASYLAEIVGTELYQIASAVDNLVLYVGDRRLIELDDVEKVVAETTQKSIFELTDAVGERKWENSLKVLNNLLRNNQSPLLIVSMLARHFRILLKAKEVSERGIPSDQTAKYLGVHGFFVGRYLSQTANFSRMELRRAFHLLSRADEDLKSSKIAPERIAESLLRNLVIRG